MNDIHCSVVKSPWTCPWLTHPVDFSSFGFPAWIFAHGHGPTHHICGRHLASMSSGSGELRDEEPINIANPCCPTKRIKKTQHVFPQSLTMAFLLRWQKAKTRFFWGRISGFPHDFPTSLRKKSRAFRAEVCACKAHLGSLGTLVPFENPHETQAYKHHQTSKALNIISQIHFSGLHLGFWSGGMLNIGRNWPSFPMAIVPEVLRTYGYTGSYLLDAFCVPVMLLIWWLP